VDGDRGVIQRINYSLASSGSLQSVGSMSTAVARGVTASSTSLTIVTTGLYNIGCLFAHQGGGSGGSRGVRIQKNSGNIDGLLGGYDDDGVAGIGFAMNLERKYVSLSAADVITLDVFQNSGSSLTATVQLWVERVV
jgi:hypothetical protein